MKKSLILFLLCFAFLSSRSQLAVYKLVGENSENTGLGFGVFAYWDIPLNEVGNNSVMIELLDGAYFPPKDKNVRSILGHISIKAGFKHIFSSDSKTGFYVEPSAGYCRVVGSEDEERNYGDGVAIAFETGYSLEVGQGDNTLLFGLKYERDMAGKKYTINTLALRMSFSFHFARGLRKG